MNYFFNNIVPPSERLRIDSTELFDEYEEWHLKCAHYVLVAALNGTCSSLRDVFWRDSATSSPILQHSLGHHGNTSFRTVEIESDGLLAYSCSVCDPTASESAVTPALVTAECERSQPELWNRVYGHACVRLTVSEAAVVLITGGFGATGAEGSHRRLGSATLVQIGQLSQPMRVELFESMYHTLTPVSVREAVMFGGRTSPAKASSNIFLLKIVKSDDDGLNRVTQRRVETSGDGPCARWRHSAAFTTCGGST